MIDNKWKIISLILFILINVTCISKDKQLESNIPSTLSLIPSPTTFVTATVQPIVSTPMPISTPSPSPTNQVTSLSQPTLTSSPTWTPAPTATPLPKLIWSSAITPPHILEYNMAEWSPTANHLLLSNCKQVDTEAGIIAVTSPPHFKPTPLNPDTFFCTSSSSIVMGWSPTGEFIVFKNPYNRQYPDTGEMWVMTREGNNPHPITSDKRVGGRYSYLVGWASDTQLIYTNYTGGGSHDMLFIDIQTGHWIMWYEVLEEDYFINADYLAISAEYPPPPGTAAIIKLPNVLQEDSINLYKHPDMHYFPTPSTTVGNIVTTTAFATWIPDTNTMLVEMAVAERNSQYLASTQLWQWEVDTAEISPFIPEGHNAQVSPNGQFLTYLTFGPPLLDAHNTPLAQNKPPLRFNNPHKNVHLQVLNMSTQQIILSLPVVTHFSGQLSTRNNRYATFSPNSRYLAFLTNDPLTLTSENKSSKVNQKDNTAYLHIFDLTTSQILNTILVNNRLPVWSNKGDKFIFKDEASNVTIWDMANSDIIKLTQSGGQRVYQLQWSFNDQYISLEFGAEKAKKSYTAVFKIL